MAQNKHKTKRRIISILCASIIALYALAIPIGAVVNSSQVGSGQTGLYGVSTFPFTVGFVQRDEALDRNYIFATDIGGYGQNNNQTIQGDDVFYWNYPDTSDEESSSIEFIQGERVWLDDASYVDLNGGYEGIYRGGYSSIDLQFNHISTDFVPTTESIIFKADNVYYNPLWLAEPDGQRYKFKDTDFGYTTMIPMVFLPALDDYNTQKFVGAYSVEATVIDMNGDRHSISYSVPIDTTSSLVGVSGIPFIHPDYLKQFINPEDIVVFDADQGEVDGSNSTICIEQYRGYLDVDYYEYVEPVPDIVGTWIFNDTFEGVEDLDLRRFLLYSDEPDSSIFARFESEVDPQLNFDISLTSISNATGYYFGIQFVRGINDGLLYLLCGNSNSSSDFIEVNEHSLKSGVLTIYKSASYEPSALSFLQANATFSPSGGSVNSLSLAEEGIWEKVTDSQLLNKCRLTYPMYGTSDVPYPSLQAQTWLAFPTAEKMLSGVISKFGSEPIIIPEIDDDMYKDYTGWLGTAVKGFFDAPLIGGISLGVIVGVIVMFSCAIALLKIFAGG